MDLDNDIDDDSFTSDQWQQNNDTIEDRGKDDERKFSKLYEMLENEENNEPIEAHIRVNVLDTLLAVLTFALVCNLSSSAVADCFKMINCIFGFTLFPSTRYLINKIFDSSSGMVYHAVCPYCKEYVSAFGRKDRSLICKSCNATINLKDPTYSDFFVLVDIQKKVENLIVENRDYYDKTIHKEFGNGQTFNDITDGYLYRKFVSSLSPQDRYNYMTCILNTDGVPVFESSKYSIWPI